MNFKNLRSIDGHSLARLESIHEKKAGSIILESKFNPYQKVVIHGKVLVAPSRGNHEAVYEKDMSEPREATPRTDYHYADEYTPDIKAGDQIYFHYLCATQPYFDFDIDKDGTHIRRIPVTDTFCSVREGKIIMNMDWVLGEPFYGRQAKIINMDGREVRGTTKMVGNIELVTGIVMTPQMDMAVISHIGKSPYFDRYSEVKAHDIVYTTKDSGFKNTIEGTELYAFKHKDIIGIYGDEPRAVGDYALVKVDVHEYKGKLIPSAKKMQLQFPATGEILSAGKNFSYKPADRIVFSRRWTKMLTKELFFVNFNDVIGTYE
jgi:hypothetical protein